MSVPGMSSAMSSSAKLQLGGALGHTPSFKKDGAAAPLPFISYSRKGDGSRGGPARSASTPAIRESTLGEISEVRGLAGDEPMKGDMDRPRSPHEALMIRLKSRAARTEADSAREFLRAYRSGVVSSPQGDAKLNQLLKSTGQRADELRKRADAFQEEVSDSERRLERINSQSVARATESELQAMSAFERSQRRILEDKKEEDLQKQREKAQTEYSKVHRRLQSELIELRDYKVLVREFTRVRLEKLYASLSKAANGRQLRMIVREMIRNGAQRILQKLEAAGLPLEVWMLEVLVNCCHLEIRIEEVEARLFSLQKVELQPKKAAIEGMLSQSKQERFEKLFARAWEPAEPRRESSQQTGWGEEEAPTDTFESSASGELGAAEDFRAEVAEAEQAVKAVESELAALQRLLHDTRKNAAAVICTRIRRSEVAGSGKEAMEWGRRVLNMLVSEDFAKATIKELQKAAPHAKLSA